MVDIDIQTDAILIPYLLEIKIIPDKISFTHNNKRPVFSIRNASKGKISLNARFDSDYIEAATIVDKLKEYKTLFYIYEKGIWSMSDKNNNNVKVAGLPDWIKENSLFIDNVIKKTSALKIIVCRDIDFIDKWKIQNGILSNNINIIILSREKK